MEQALLVKVADAVQAIEHDPNSNRIKKLMAFGCYRVWKGQQALNELDLHQVISQILKRYSTPEDLQSQLYYLASTLNKTVEYTLVANAILGYLAPVYAHQQAPAGETVPLDFASVAHQLQHDPDALRIKKLLVCACGHPWQNDVAVLDGMAMESLVSQMRQIAPTGSALKATLDSVVATLNRAQVYAAIADRVVDAFAVLYDDAVGPSEASDAMDCTELLEPNSASPGMADRTMDLAAVELSQIGDRSVAVEPSRAIASAGISLSRSSNPSSNRALTLSVLARTLPRVELGMTDLYDLRLEIIKYTCPLRAKVLLFSVLRQHTDWAGHDYSLLKTTDLSALLSEMFQTYKQREQLCATLQAVATQLTPSSDYLQACGAIVRAIAPWYDALSLSTKTTGQDDYTMPDLNTQTHAEQTDVQFSQGDVTGMMAQETQVNGGAFYESA